MNKEFLNKRYKKEKRFILLGRVAVSLTIIFLVILLGSIFLKGISGFYTTNIFLQTNLSQEIIDPEDKKNVEEIYKSSWRKIARNSIYDVLSEFNKSKNIDKISRKDKRDFLKLLFKNQFLALPFGSFKNEILFFAFRARIFFLERFLFFWTKFSHFRLFFLIFWV